MTNSSGSGSILASFLAGGIAGSVCEGALYPLDTLKTRLQAGHPWRKIFYGVYRGVTTAMMAGAVSGAFFFMAYNMVMVILTGRFDSDDAASAAIAGAAGGVISCIARVPLEIVKQKKQVGSVPDDLSTYKVLAHIHATEGAAGWFSGLTQNLCRDVPFNMIELPIYEFLRGVLTPKIGADMAAVFGGAIAGGITAAVTCPLDVLKTRNMIAHENRTVLSILRNEGVGSLFNGVVPRVTWISLGGSVFFSVYQQSNQVITEFLRPQRNY